jgi:hypothetical protein
MRCVRPRALDDAEAVELYPQNLERRIAARNAGHFATSSSGDAASIVPANSRRLSSSTVWVWRASCASLRRRGELIGEVDQSIEVLGYNGRR